MSTTEDTDTTAGVTPAWGNNTPSGAKTVFARIVKEGANVPLFLSQTLVNALRDVGYNHTTSAICEHVDNAIQWNAGEVRVYLHQRGKRGKYKIDALVLDNGAGMSPNVLRAVTAFGGSMCFENRQGIGRYGMGMKAAALSMGPVLEIYTWQEAKAYYQMTLDVEAIGNDRSNLVSLPAPNFSDVLPAEVRQILTSAMTYPKNPDESQTLLVDDPEQLGAELGRSGTIIYVPDCDRLTYRKASTLVDHAVGEMSRIYRRQLADGLRLFVNNRRVEPFDPTYYMESARHARVEGINESRSRLVREWSIAIPVEEGAEESQRVQARLFRLPIEDWDRLERKVVKNDLQVYDSTGISFVRNDREVHHAHVSSIVGKFSSTDYWWRLQIDLPATLDEAFGVSFNKQGVRPKNYVTEIIKKEIRDDLRVVRDAIKRHQSERALAASKSKLTDAEKRANESESLMTTLLPQPVPDTDEGRRALEENLRTLAVTHRRENEDDDAAYERVKNSRYITSFVHDCDAPFYRVEYQYGRVILTINSAHPFFQRLYEPLANLAKTASTPMADVDEERTTVDSELAATAREALICLQLTLMSLARTQSTVTSNDPSGEQQRLFDTVRKQWSINLETMLGHPG